MMTCWSHTATVMVWGKQAGSLHSTRLLWRTSLGHTMNTRTDELIDPVGKWLLTFSLMLEFPRGKHKLCGSCPWLHPQRERSLPKPHQLTKYLRSSYDKAGLAQLQREPHWCCTTKVTTAPPAARTAQVRPQASPQALQPLSGARPRFASSNTKYLTWDCLTHLLSKNLLPKIYSLSLFTQLFIALLSIFISRV